MMKNPEEELLCRQERRKKHPQVRNSLCFRLKLLKKLINRQKCLHLDFLAKLNTLRWAVNLLADITNKIKIKIKIKNKNKNKNERN